MRRLIFCRTFPVNGSGFGLCYRRCGKLPLAGAELSLCELVGVPLGVEGEDHYLVLLGDVVVAINRATPYLRQ